MYHDTCKKYNDTCKKCNDTCAKYNDTCTYSCKNSHLPIAFDTNI